MSKSAVAKLAAKPLSTPALPSHPVAFCGIDVAKLTLAVALQSATGKGLDRRDFANTAAGHRQLIAWLHKQNGLVRVSLEATGAYSVPLSLALDAATAIQLAVLNPKTVHDFAKTLGRSKTDRADAAALAEYSRRMEFAAWVRPTDDALQLRAICRHIHALNADRTQTGNRLEAAQAAPNAPRAVLQDLKHAHAAIAKRILKMRRDALAFIAKRPQLNTRFQLLIAMPGIGEIAATQMLGELAALDPNLTVRQLVAMSGLDPAHTDSGTSVHRKPKISRHGNRYLRAALYFPALVASRHDPYQKAFYEQLQARHKTKLQALMAVARKMLHAIHGMFKHNTPYDGAKLFPAITLPA
jgi:transposase